LKHINGKHFEKLVEGEEKGEIKLMKYLYETAANSSKHFYIAVNIGYLIAIICTVVVMLIFEHG